MQRIERYGVIALVFLIVTIVAVSFWGDGAPGAPWTRWLGASKKPEQGAQAAARPPRRKPNVAAAQTRRTVGPDLPVSEPESHALAAPLAPRPEVLAEPNAQAPALAQGLAPAGTLAEQAPGPALAVESPYAAGAAGIAPGPQALAQREAPQRQALAERVAAAPSGPRRYVVGKGDSLSSIASRELGSAKRWTEIQALNGGLDPRRLAVGAQILLPPREGSAPVAQAAPPAAKAEPRTAAAAQPAGRSYVVRQGDTLSEIASRELGSAGRWREIAEANPGLDPARLVVGARLALPAAPHAAPRGTPSERPSPAVARAEPAPERPRGAAPRDGRPRVR
jgi:nucleoid-associated protein YgaU